MTCIRCGMASITKRRQRLSQMLVLAQQPHLQLSASVLPFWVSLLQQSGGKQDGSVAARPPIPEDAAAALLNIAGALHAGVMLAKICRSTVIVFMRCCALPGYPSGEFQVGRVASSLQGV